MKEVYPFTKIRKTAMNTHMEGMPLNRWSLFIDVEGFSAIYRANSPRALWLLHWLTRGLYLIASNFSLRQGERLFIHQIGDGFIVVSDFPDAAMDRPMSIAIALMQYLLKQGGVARAGVAAGEFGDIRGCLPPEVRAETDDGGYVKIPNGKMHIFPVMGDALINSYRAQANETKGPFLFVDPKLRQQMNGLKLKFLTRSDKRVVVDWVASTPPLLSAAFEALVEPGPSLEELKLWLSNYVQSSSASDAWKRNALRMLI